MEHRFAATAINAAAAKLCRVVVRLELPRVRPTDRLVALRTPPLQYGDGLLVRHVTLAVVVHFFQLAPLLLPLLLLAVVQLVRHQFVQPLALFHLLPAVALPAPTPTSAALPARQLHHVGQPEDLHGPREAGRVDVLGGEVVDEQLLADGGGHQHELERGPAGQQVAQAGEQEVAVALALVALVDDESRHTRQRGVSRQAAQQYADGAEENARARRGAALEADLVAHALADVLAALGRHSLCQRDGAYAARLRANDVARVRLVRGGGVEVVEDELRHLRALAASRGAADDCHLVHLVQLQYRLALLPYRQPLPASQHRSVARVGVGRNGDRQ